jgi:lipopolysaccharide transport system ATP-binding protein
MSERSNSIMMELENVSLSYHVGKKNFDHGKHHILNQVSMRLYEGETLGIMGRNGVGKTTMLRLMAGILAPTHGSVSIHPGKSVSLLTLGLGFRAELSGRDNSLLAAMLQGATRKQAESYLDDIMEFSELGDSFYEPVKQYSAGMRARLAFTTALMTHVDVLLIDEILSVGDAHFRGKAQAAMTSRISGEQTVVFVSHMAEQIKDVCDRVIWLDGGRIVMEGSAEEVTQAYANFINEARKAGELQA